jgi:hypothetical protein
MSLDPQYKVAILTSVITIIGFLIAFQTATTTWKQQMHTSLRLQAAHEINSTYSRATELITSIRIFADLNLDLINKLKGNMPDIEITSAFNFVQSKYGEFLSNRDELSLLHLKAYNFIGKYSTVLSSTWKSFDQLERINDALRLVAEKMWVFIPQITSEHINYKKLYLQYTDCSKLEELSEQCNLSHGFIAALAGNINGRLTAPIFLLNLSSLLTLFQKSKWIDEAYSIIRENKYKTSDKNNKSVPLGD